MLRNTYPTPATRDEINETECMWAYPVTIPVTPPTMHRVPMTNVGIADCRHAVKYVRERDKKLS